MAYRLQDRVPDRTEIKSAQQLKKILESQFSVNEPVKLPFVLEKPSEERLTLPPALARAVMDFLELVASGRGIRILPVATEFTTQQTADFLIVSREYRNKLLVKNKIPFTLRERHHGVQNNCDAPCKKNVTLYASS